MFDISFHINLFIFLIEVEHPLKTDRIDIALHKRIDIALPIYFFNWSRTSFKNIK